MATQEGKRSLCLSTTSLHLVQAPTPTAVCKHDTNPPLRLSLETCMLLRKPGGVHGWLAQAGGCELPAPQRSPGSKAGSKLGTAAVSSQPVHKAQLPAPKLSAEPDAQHTRSRKLPGTPAPGTGIVTARGCSRHGDAHGKQSLLETHCC